MGNWSDCILPEGGRAEGPLGLKVQGDVKECGQGYRYQAMVCYDQDNRLVDLPVSLPFFRLLCMGDIKSTMSKLLHHAHCPDGQSEASTEDGQETPYSPGSEDDDEDSKSEFILDPPKPRPPAWYHGILTWDHFQLVNPHRSDHQTDTQTDRQTGH